MDCGTALNSAQARMDGETAPAEPARRRLPGSEQTVMRHLQDSHHQRKHRQGPGSSEETTQTPSTFKHVLIYSHTCSHTLIHGLTHTWAIIHSHMGSHTYTRARTCYIHLHNYTHGFICARTQAQACSTLTYTHAYTCMHIYNHTCAPMPTYSHAPIQSQCAGMITHMLTKIQHMALRLILSHSHTCMLTHMFTYNHTHTYEPLSHAYTRSLTCVHTHHLGSPGQL